MLEKVKTGSGSRGNGKVRFYATQDGKHKYYAVSTRLYGKPGTKYFPRTEEGLKEANSYLENYKNILPLVRSEIKKDVKLGIMKSKIYLSGELKFISLYFKPENNRFDIVVRMNSDSGNKKTGRSLMIGDRGFDTIFNIMLKKLINFYNLDPENEDIKARIVKTRETMLEKYKALCKEHELPFYP